MVDLSAFQSKPGYQPKPNGQTAPKLVKRQPSSVQPAAMAKHPVKPESPPVAAPGSMVLPHIKEQMDAAGWPHDEPMRIMFEGLASKQDRMEIMLAAFGHDAGRMAADAARREVAAGMRKLTWNIGLWRWSIVILALFVAAGYGWIARMVFVG